eukprot:gene6679-8263_t
MKGLFPSAIHWNFVGENVAEGRRQFNIPDTNMFFTSFILENLFEAQHLGAISIPTSVVKDGTDALLEFRDKNAGDGIPFYNFWVRKFDPIFGGYYDDQNNFDSILKQYGSMLNYSTVNQDYFKRLNISQQFTAVTMGYKNLKTLSTIRDVDDSVSCWVIDYYLNNLKSLYPEELVKNWNKQNSKKWEAINLILTYAYRPFSKDFDQSSTESLTYYIIHPFLEQWRTKYSNNPEKLESLVLVSAWLYNITNQKLTLPYNHMPSLVNNVDFGVSVNALFSIFQFIRTEEKTNGQFPVISKDLENMITSTTLLIEWALESRVIYKRPDLTLLYYWVPPFHNFLTRMIYFLEEFKTDIITLQGKQFPALLQSTLTKLKRVGESVITREILNTAQRDCNDIYWETFLGNADTVNGTIVKQSEDRFFSTALAINALIDTWTVPFGYGLTPHRVWKAHTPIDVKLIVKSTIEYLNCNVLRDGMKSSGPFFTFSPNTPDNDPLRYPSNFCIYLNGTKCDPHQAQSEPVMSAMTGVISEQEYKNMLSQPWANLKIPSEFRGYNFFPMPYFESNIYTYSISLLAFSKYLVVF